VVAKFRSKARIPRRHAGVAKLAKTGLPEIVAVNEFRDILGIGDDVTAAPPPRPSSEGAAQFSDPRHGEGKRRDDRAARDRDETATRRSGRRRTMHGATCISVWPALLVIAAVIIFPWVFTLI